MRSQTHFKLSKAKTVVIYSVSGRRIIVSIVTRVGPNVAITITTVAAIEKKTLYHIVYTDSFRVNTAILRS